MLGAGLCILRSFNGQQPVSKLWTLMLDTERDHFLLRLWLQGEVLLGYCPCCMQAPQMATGAWRVNKKWPLPRGPGLWFGIWS